MNETVSINCTSPLGPIEIRATARGICTVSFAPKDQVHSESDSTAPTFLYEAVEQLDEYFAGKRTSFSLPLDMIGTEFRKRVWQALLEIPYGATVAYQDIALRLGDANAVRAVGGANNHNPIGIIVPCHRVIGKNGALIGYEGGLERKHWLLRHERSHSPQAQLDLF